MVFGGDRALAKARWGRGRSGCGEVDGGDGEARNSPVAAKSVNEDGGEVVTWSFEFGDTQRKSEATARVWRAGHLGVCKPRLGRGFSRRRRRSRRWCPCQTRWRRQRGVELGGDMRALPVSDRDKAVSGPGQASAWAREKVGRTGKKRETGFNLGRKRGKRARENSAQGHF